ncbi:hypothetical protein Leryth_027295 [Lithospermum erythrorhizon]|nr:hypothetical protein Leryth_027295 [Lithospermum erythrorhizon]
MTTNMQFLVILFFLLIILVFSSLSSADGNSKISMNYNQSYVTNNNYREALGKAILFFEGQRSGKLPSSQRVKWRGDSALLDGRTDNVNLVGGYYDAGDNVKFMGPMSYSMTLLSWAATEYEAGLSSSNQLEQLLQAIRWGTDYILKAHTSPIIFYAQVGDANNDHKCWERPEDMDTLRTLYKLTTSTPGTEVAAEAAAALAAASIAFKKVDPGYSAKLLTGSKSLFEFADKYRGSFQGSCPLYCSYSGFQDELLWAASWLFKATGEGTYLNYVSSNEGWSQKANEFSWDNKFAGAQMLLAQEFLKGNQELSKFKGDADSFVCSLMPGSSSQQIKTTPGGLIYVRDYSSNLQYSTSGAMLLFFYSKILQATPNAQGLQCGSSNFSPSKIKDFATSQVDYILGKNPMKMSYMVGYGSTFPKQVHHRGASIPSIKTHPTKVGCDEGMSTFFKYDNPNPNVHVGAVVGGPDRNDQFTDSRSNYAQTEPTTYINAGFLGCVAALL